MVVVADVCSALLLATVPLAHLFGVLTVPHVLAVAFLGPAVGTFFDGAVFGAVPMLVGRSRIAQANACVWSLQGMVEVVMPAAVGVALAVLRRRPCCSSTPCPSWSRPRSSRASPGRCATAAASGRR